MHKHDLADELDAELGFAAYDDFGAGRGRRPGRSGSIRDEIEGHHDRRLFAGIIFLAGELLKLEAVPLKARYLILLRRIVALSEPVMSWNATGPRV